MSVQRLGRIVLASLVLVALSVRAEAEEPELSLPQSTADQARLQLSTPMIGSQPVDARYRRINGQWWYLLDNNRWALWDGGKWTIPSQKANPYQEWRRQQFSQRYSRSGADDETMRRQEVDRWRGMAGPESRTSLTQSNADYHQQMDRFHNTLRATPYDYRVGTPGHGLFDCDPDRVIANSGRFNYATSGGGYMGSALSSPFGY
ncbi:MAG: hypothetical protein ACREHD_24620 [Pirellulales bacterium]